MGNGVHVENISHVAPTASPTVCRYQRGPSSYGASLVQKLFGVSVPCVSENLNIRLRIVSHRAYLAWRACIRPGCPAPTGLLKTVVNQPKQQKMIQSMHNQHKHVLMLFAQRHKRTFQFLRDPILHFEPDSAHVP